MIWLKRALLLFLLYLLFLIWSAPATLLRPLFNYWLPQVQLGQLDGSLWQGSATPVLLTIGETGLYLGKVEWRLAPWSVLSLQPQLSLRSKADTHYANLQLQLNTAGELSLHDSDAAFPLALLEPWYPLLLTGDVEIVVDQLRLSQQELLALDARAWLRNTDWRFGSQPQLLGDYQAILYPLDTQTLQVDITDMDAYLGLTGSITADASRRYELTALLLPSESLAPEVKKSLQLFYPPDRRGESRIRLQGRW